MEWGVTTLEMDVVISKDHLVVLSHEPYLSHKICSDSAGNPLVAETTMQYNMYEMTYHEIKMFDCGSMAPEGFDEQRAVPGPKPLLSEVIEEIEAQTVKLNRVPVKYNIEIKSMAGYDEIYHPSPEIFVSLVLEVIESLGIETRSIIQSFDFRALEEVRKQAPDMQVSMLIDNDQDPLLNMIQLGFNPHIYSPNYRLVNDSLVRYLHQKNIALIPWTVNDTATMKKLIKLGVDGIISDYPEKLIELQ